mgnify:CR=1 FL=1
MSELRYGKYLVKETKAPTGFVLDENVYSVSVEENGKTYTVENKAGVGFINAAQKGSLKIVKTSSDGKVEGFSFRVTGVDYDKTFKTDKNGEIVIEGMRIGDYTVSEVSDKASAGYIRAKEIIKLINSVADVINNDRSINGKLKVVFIEDYRVSNAEWIFAAADVSEQISTASKEASGTGNMKFMLNGAPTLGTMDGANVEIVHEVGEENAFIFGLSSQEVINYENNGGYNPTDVYFNDWEIKRVVDQLMDGTYSNGDHNMYINLYNSLLNTQCTDKADTYFILKDFRSYADAQQRVEEAYRDQQRWSKMAMMNTACSGKFTSDRTIEEYVRDIWHLEKVEVPSGQDLFE